MAHSSMKYAQKGQSIYKTEVQIQTPRPSHRRSSGGAFLRLPGRNQQYSVLY